MADYGKYAMSGPFSAFLDDFVIECDEDNITAVVHETCGAMGHIIDDAESMQVILQAIIDHDCP